MIKSKCLAQYINTTSHIKWHLNKCTKQSSEDEKKSVRISLELSSEIKRILVLNRREHVYKVQHRFEVAFES